MKQTVNSQPANNSILYRAVMGEAVMHELRTLDWSAQGEDGFRLFKSRVLDIADAYGAELVLEVLMRLLVNNRRGHANVPGQSRAGMGKQ